MILLAIALAADQPAAAATRTIIIDNSGCHAGRTARYQADQAEWTARREAARLRAQGYDVRIVVRDDGVEVGDPRQPFSVRRYGC